MTKNIEDEIFRPGGPYEPTDERYCTHCVSQKKAWAIEPYLKRIAPDLKHVQIQYQCKFCYRRWTLTYEEDSQ